MRALKIIAIAALSCACGSACHSMHSSQKSDDGLAWTAQPVAPPTNGAIFQADTELELAANPIARHVGDIVTISNPLPTPVKFIISSSAAVSTTL